MKLYFSITLFVFIFICSTSAQKRFSFNQGNIQQEEFYQTIPFEYYLNKVIIEANVNGVKGRYIVDTGAMCIVFKDSTKHQNFTKIGRIPISDANGIRKESEIVLLDTIRLGDLVYTNIPALSTEALEGPLKCFGVDGMIGSNLLRFGAFKLDMKEKNLILTDSYKKFGLSTKEGQKLGLSKMQSSPYIRVSLNGWYQYGVLVDTGSSAIYMFNQSVVDKLRKKSVFNKPAYQSSGTNSQGAWGLDSVDITTNIWQVDEVKVADVSFTNLQLRSDETSSRIGMKLMENGELVLDYPKKRFFFHSYSQVNDAISKLGFGIDFASINDTIKVNGIWLDTPAAEKGVTKGDVLVDIKGLHFEDKELCEIFTQLSMITQQKNELEFVFRRKDSGEEYSVLLERLQ
nr:aspartyl protease family protein [uncultured Carboxylicivirga sp.]